MMLNCVSDLRRTAPSYLTDLRIPVWPWRRPLAPVFTRWPDNVALKPVHTVAEKCDCRGRRIRRLSPLSRRFRWIALFCDSVDRALRIIPIRVLYSSSFCFCSSLKTEPFSRAYGVNSSW